jgi:hypothetical protein
MKFINKKMVSMILTASMISLTGCNDDAITNNQATISYINALDEQATFYIKKSSASSSVYSNKHKVVSLMSGEASNEIRHEWFGFETSRLAVEDTNGRDEQESITELLKDDRDYWLIAWINGRDYKLSLLKKSSSDQDGLYRVRVFSNEKLDIYLDGNETKFLTTKVGEASNYFSVEKCTGLVIEDNEINLCTVDFNRSYLAVVDAKGLISLVEERN